MSPGDRPASRASRRQEKLLYLCFYLLLNLAEDVSIEKKMKKRNVTVRTAPLPDFAVEFSGRCTLQVETRSWSLGRGFVSYGLLFGHAGTLNRLLPFFRRLVRRLLT